MSGFQRSFVSLLAVGLLHLMVSGAAAQFENFWQSAGPTEWNSGSWSFGGPPDAANFQDFAIIANNGTAFVTNTPADPGGIRLGQSTGSGTLEIRNNGNLTAITTSVNDGAVVVGDGGTGVLTVEAGGSLTGVTITSGGAGSMINLEGTAQLSSTTSMNLNALTDISGQSVDFNAGTSLSFGGSSALQIEIAGASAPLLKTGSTVNLGGTLQLDFGGGTPTPGSSWNLFDAGGIAGSFSDITLASGALGPGQRFRIRSVPSGASMNGVFGQLLFDQLLTLEINRDTGAMSIRNPSASTPVSLDAYAITSGNAVFNPANGVWSSLQDQAVSGWIEANPKTTQLVELDTNASTTVNGNSQLSLGTPWAPQFSAHGENLENVVFQYEFDGEVINAPVVYTGVAVNDMALIVDPATGQAQLRNASGFSVNIEGYAVGSESGSLNPDDNDWDSLEENAALSAWLEANPSDESIAEFKTMGVETFSSNEAYNLGQLFDIGGMQDLLFGYLIAGQSTLTPGRVLYQSLPSVGLPGDYNNDGKVDAADYVVWRKNDGSQAGYDTWRANFGAMAGAGGGAGASGALAAVPEPTTTWLLAVVFAVFGAYGRRRAETPSSDTCR